MQVDISFEFAKAYNVTKVDIVKGQKFSILTDTEEPTRWFADNDKVLSIDTVGNNSDCVADNLGTSVILIMNPDMQIIKELTIKVVDSIVEPAKDLGLSADKPVNKI